MCRDIFGDLPHKRVDFWTRHLIHISHLRNMRKMISPCISFERRGIQSIRSWLAGALVQGSICCHAAGRRLRREVRAWFRGIHRSVTVADVDMVVCNNERKWGYVFSLSHKYLSLNIQKTDTLRGGAFFAAIRLVIHAFEGRHINRDLVFVQGKFQSLSHQSVLCLTFILSQPNAHRVCLNQTETSPRDVYVISTPSAFYPAEVSRREERQDCDAVGSSSINRIVEVIVSGGYLCPMIRQSIENSTYLGQKLECCPRGDGF